MGKIIDIEKIIWDGAHAKRYRADPKEIEQTAREKRIQREIDEMVRKRALKISENTEKPPPPEEPA